jgi:hypothetical protein
MTNEDHLMNLAAIPDPVPLSLDPETDAIRIGATGVTLDTLVAAFERGATAEEIAQDYPVSLPDVYAVIAYYLRHRPEVEVYLARRRREHDELRAEIEGRADYAEFRQRLLAKVEKVRGGAT